MLTEEMKNEFRAMISEYMEGEECETEKLKNRVVEKLVETMGLDDLEKHAVHEIGEFLDCYGMGSVEGMLHEFAELKIVMCAVKKHFPEGMVTRIWKEAVEGYAEKHEVK